ncbi:MAG TPA: Spy/CpxP family protein refolding chaperone [Pyrinomonadaceae bacterium]|nr:Spy/CpxP family protein refolding chaperone [Pyrinomonadaceae bacterium]
MSLLKKLTIVALVCAFTSAGAVYAQQPQSNGPAAGNPQARRMMRRKMRRRDRMGALRGFRQLNLTDQQQQQARAIRQSFAQSTQSQRQELRQLVEQRRAGSLTADNQARAKELRRQLMQGRQNMRTQLSALLTAEQKAKLDELIKARRAQMLGRRNAAPTQKP